MAPSIAASQITSLRTVAKCSRLKKKGEGSKGSTLANKDEMKGRTKRKRNPQMENIEAGKAEMGVDQSIPRATKNKDKKDKKTEKKSASKEEIDKNQKKDNLIMDDRFAAAQLDPRFQRMPKREAKVPVDSRFARMLTDRNFSSSSAPVDKRGKARKSKEVNPLLRYYLHEKEPEVDKVMADDEEVQRELPEEENENIITTDESTSTTDEDEDDDISINSDLCRFLMANHENTPTIEQETHRIAIVNMDWNHIKSVDLYVVMSSCLPKGGQILSVNVYPSEFGLKCMEVESLRGAASLIFDDGEQSDEEPNPEVLNERHRAYELDKLRYYYAIAIFDSSATANHVYNNLDGTELIRTSNVFDLRFVPDSMEFKHPPRDVTTVAPTNYMQPEFQTRALQHNKVNVTWDVDVPHVKNLWQKINAEKHENILMKVDDLNEYLASSDGSDEKHEDAEKCRSLLLNNSDTEKSDNDKDMEITFDTGLEDLSKHILEKKDKKGETVWEQALRKRNEKKKAKKNWSRNSSDDEDSDYDVKAPDKSDAFFDEESSDADLKLVNKRNKGSKNRMKHNKVSEQTQEIKKEHEASRAELELLFAEEQEMEKGPKSYNIKTKKTMGKKGKETAVNKLPNVDFSDDPRFSALFNNHLYALDPTDPHYKRSAAFARQRFQKQVGSIVTDVEDDREKKVPLLSEDDREKKVPLLSEDENELMKKPLGCSEIEKHQLSSTIRSLKRNIGNLKKSI